MKRLLHLLLIIPLLINDLSVKVVGNPIQTVSETKSEIGVGNSGMFIDLVVILWLCALE